MKIYLRPVTEEDGALIVKWRNNPIVAKHCFNRNPITIESNKKFYHEMVETGHYKQYIVERIEEFTGVVTYPIATVYLKDIDRTNKRCELCIFTRDDEEWNTESQTIAIKQLLKVCFEELGMHKVYSYVFTRYEDEKELLENAGFKEETVLKGEAVGIDGSYDDAYRMSIFEEEYKGE
ncbi:GNAT family N-acetyltransferase [Butyrivibrio sp. INlla16]|uniref:GNAT family N-acetyltransferase n=1 Tax=Butyrivibrio sp. INlla16 TaxID=1520807 RepID=UPI00088BF91E|nr:GNAT family protein [Butyrivibrio sp. INlla16]SDB69002.1 Protein N-acetyltransferase, RimJ/RimL family [Butyrivibrio sp. INlla16]